MSDCGCHAVAKDEQERRVLLIALALNAMMAVVGGIAGWIAQSAGLLADALDMLSDATAYAIGLMAIRRSLQFKRHAATLSGVLLLILGIGLLVEVVRRAFSGSEPIGPLIIGTAAVSLIVNVVVLRLLQPLRRDEVHLRAVWIFTRADIVANMGVIIAGLVVLATGWRYADLIAGGLIGLYVCKEAFEILSEARSASAMQDPLSSQVHQ